MTAAPSQEWAIGPDHQCDEEGAQTADNRDMTYLDTLGE